MLAISPSAATPTHLDIHALEVSHVVRVDTLLVDRARRHLVLRDDAVLDGDAVVVVTERGRLVNDTRAGRVGYILVADDAEGAAGVLCGSGTRISEKSVTAEGAKGM